MDASIIIVNWNTKNLLRRCIDSVPEAFSENENYEVIVVDNDSSDQSVAIAEGSVQKFQSFMMKKNLGFAKANNVGIRQATGETLILLNPDTEVLPGSLTSLIKFTKTRQDVAAVGPKLLNTDSTLQPSCRRFPEPLVLAMMFLKIHHFFPNLEIYCKYQMMDFIYDHEAFVDQIMGACMVIPRKAIDKIGLLDEKYWIWFEEVDWCKRAYEAGMKVWFSPSAEIIHHGGVSFKQAYMPIRKEWRFIRSAMRYVKKHHKIGAWILLWLVVPLALFIDSFSFALWLKKTRVATN